MTKYIMRLDDASEYMDVPKWKRMEDLLDAYHIKPLVGIIPDNKDPSLVNVYPRDVNFWETVDRWGKRAGNWPYMVVTISIRPRKGD